MLSVADFAIMVSFLMLPVAGFAKNTNDEANEKMENISENSILSIVIWKVILFVFYIN